MPGTLPYTHVHTQSGEERTESGPDHLLGVVTRSDVRRKVTKTCKEHSRMTLVGHGTAVIVANILPVVLITGMQFVAEHGFHHTYLTVTTLATTATRAQHDGWTIPGCIVDWRITNSEASVACAVHLLGTNMPAHG